MTSQQHALRYTRIYVLGYIQVSLRGEYVWTNRYVYIIIIIIIIIIILFIYFFFIFCSVQQSMIIKWANYLRCSMSFKIFIHIEYFKNI